MRYYPPNAHMTAIDISDRMLEKAGARAARTQVTVDLRLMDAQHLDFADGTFDAVVATCVFCSVPAGGFTAMDVESHMLGMIKMIRATKAA